MHAKNFDLELFSLHPNWGHGTSESALGNSPPSRPVSHIAKLKETDKKDEAVSQDQKSRVT